MGVTIGIVIGIVMVILSLYFRNDLGVLRNLVLIWGTPLAILLALWRSLVAERQVKVTERQVKVAERQAEVAQRSLLAVQYQRGSDLLEHGRVSMHIVGIRVLRNLALEHPNEYRWEVDHLLEAQLSAAYPREREVLKSALLKIRDYKPPSMPQ